MTSNRTTQAIARAMVGDAERCIAAGANAYVSRPYHLTDLLEVIRKQLEHRVQ